MKKVRVRTECMTCDPSIVGIIDELDFLDNDGNSLDYATADLHCGVPGHNVQIVSVTREEFDAATDDQLI